MKHIKINTNTKDELIEKFKKYINDTKFTDNMVHFTASLDTSTIAADRPTVYISPLAYLKMMLYVRDTDTEIAWHGVVDRNIDENWYHIKDVFLYPQMLSAATVNTDQEKYNKWIEEIEDDETINTMRFQGHSHVNFGTTPSGTDTNYYADLLQTLPKNDYYIFMIMNKAGSTHCLIYDLAKNLIYENGDIDVQILTNDSYDLQEDIAKDKEKYCAKPVYQTNYHELPSYNNDRYKNYYGGNTYPTSRHTAYDEASIIQDEDINDYLDEIDNKYKNARLKHSNKKKGGKK